MGKVCLDKAQNLKYHSILTQPTPMAALLGGTVVQKTKKRHTTHRDSRSLFLDPRHGVSSHSLLALWPQVGGPRPPAPPRPPSSTSVFCLSSYYSSSLSNFCRILTLRPTASPTTTNFSIRTVFLWAVPSHHTCYLRELPFILSPHQ